MCFFFPHHFRVPTPFSPSLSIKTIHNRHNPSFTIPFALIILWTSGQPSSHPIIPSPPHHHLQKCHGPCRAPFPSLQGCQRRMVRVGEDDGARDSLQRLLPDTAALLMAHPEDILKRTQPGESCGKVLGKWHKSESHMVSQLDG